MKILPIQVSFSIMELEKIMHELNRLYDEYEDEKQFQKKYPHINEFLERLMEMSLEK
ncbi:hypothetical protein K1X76_10865 [bacterium]|nr:hypothetical protein [bacterium]